MFRRNNRPNKIIENGDCKSVTFTSDINQWKYVVTNALYILKQTKSDIKINIVLIDSEEVKDVVSEKIGKNNIEVFYISTDQLPILSSKLNHVTSATNIRLFLPNILPDYSTLYLDVDTIVEGDISLLLKCFDTKILYGQNEATKIFIYLYILNLKVGRKYNSSKYYNAGSLHLPLQTMRDSNFSNEAVIFHNKNINKLKFVDQDIINSIIEIEDGPWQMNIARDNWPKKVSPINLTDDFPKIYHFLGNSKQWDSSSENSNLKKKELEHMYSPKQSWQSFHDEIWGPRLNYN